MAMKIDQIMTQVFDALAHDYAGMPECDDGSQQMWANVCSKAWKSKILDDKLFYQYMQQRIASLGDRNLCFLLGPEASYRPETCGFTVRRCGDELHVVSVEQDGRLVPGDVVELVNKTAPSKHLAYAIGNPSGSDVEERQDWSQFLLSSSHFVVRHADGSREDLRTKRWPQEDPEPAACGFEVLADGTCVLRVTQLEDEEAAQVLEAHAEEVRAAGKLVIDLRTCGGGIESMAYPLLNWLFDEPTNLKELQEAETILTNYTVANCDRREAQIAQLRKLALAEGDAGETLSWLDENIEAVREHRGKGYVREIVEPEDLPIEAGPAGQRAVLLTDTATADAAEWLALVAKKSPRVTQLGRATSGNLDYSNPLAVAYENRFIFVYPMSKTKAAAEGRGMHGRGVEPDVYVPFAPEECLRDVLMERALAL